MKKTIYNETLRCALSMLVALFAFANMAWADTKSQRTQVNIDQSVGAGYTLYPGNMYIVRGDMTLTATSGNGLNVATIKSGEQAPILYIPAGVTVTVKGADATGTTGAGAGIYVPSNAELIITGAGTLYATGGNAASGGNGENGQNGGNYVGNDAEDWKDWTTLTGQHAENMTWSGAGGRGGNGGGGAAAGIGGMGGQGGQGGQGAAAVGNGDTTVDGKGGTKGSDGAPGGSMGKVYIMGTVNVTATAGNNTSKTAGTVGTQGYSLVHTSGLMKYIAGAGGGGGGGGVGCVPTYGIGAGAPGAGGGAGGGSGAFDQIVRTTTLQKVDNNSGRASSGNGGTGSINGGSPSSERNRDEGRSGTVIVSVCPQVGGVGGNGGAQGTNATTANNGYLYVASTATVNGGTGSFGGNTGSAPTDMQITITFVSNEYATTKGGGGDVTKGGQVGQITVNIGDPLPAAVKTTYFLTAKGNATATPEYPEVYESGHKYFAGYYSSENGLGTRIYKGISTGGTNLDNGNGVNAVPFAQDVTLYAHFTHVHHVINWDYTYSNGVNGSGTSTWVNLNKTEYLNKGKLKFFGPLKADGTRDLIKEVVMTAYIPSSETTSEKNYTYIASPEAGVQNHTRAVGNIFLHAGSGSDQLSTENNIDVYFTDDQLVTFSDYQFIPCNDDGTEKTTGWQSITLRPEHTTVFSYTGAKDANQFTLKWEVKLTGLKVYPDKIFVKPLYLDSNSKWSLISQLPTRYDGVTSLMDASQSNVTSAETNPEASYAVYTGEYPVWIKNETADPNYEYDNKIGLVGFTVNGKMYYMDATHGDVSNADMQSTDHLHYSDTDTEPHKEHIVTMTVPASAIPVLRLEGNGGQLAAGTPAIIVDENRTNSFTLSNSYSAVYAGYKLLGWNTQADGMGTRYDNAENNVTVTTTGQALTLYAEWAENVAPVITTKEILYKQEGATVVVTVSDNVSTPETGLKVYSIVSDESIADPADPGKEWTEVTASTEGEGIYQINLYDIDIINKSWAWVYVKAVDAADNIAYQSSPSAVKIDGINPTYDIYPEGNVCNFDVQIIAKDNIQITKIEYRKSTDAADTWTDVTSSATGTDKEKAFTVAKLTSNTCEDGETVHHSVDLSLRITDGAGNVTTYENFTHMYYDHVWDTATPHQAMVPDGNGNYVEHTYYNCKHECGHIWDVQTIGGEPSILYNRDDAEQHKQQGLMRSETSEYLAGSGTVVITDNEGIIGIANDINTAITTGEATDCTITLIADTKVGTENPSTLTNPGDGKTVTIDLNGHGLKVGETDAEITGNENVTILLNDNGSIPYTNKSQVSGSPIKYHRTFAKAARTGNWQALYLPFAAGTVTAPDGETYTFGTPGGVNITAEKAELSISKGASPLTANTHYFVKSSNGEVLIKANATLTAATTPSEITVSTKQDGAGTYTIKGSLTDGDNEAYYTGEEPNKVLHTFWILTNGGAFKYANAGAHQRPYHWVIYDKTERPANLKPLTFVLVEDDEEATSMQNVQAAGEMLSGDIYTVSGVKMPKNAKLPRGLYISNGKKFSVK